jgi:hypothetical protein
VELRLRCPQAALVLAGDAVGPAACLGALSVLQHRRASRRVAEKAGFHYEGMLRNAGYVHSGRVDLELWSLVAADVR